MTDTTTAEQPKPSGDENSVRDMAVRYALNYIRKQCGKIPVVIITPSTDQDRVESGARVGSHIAYGGSMAAGVGMVEEVVSSEWPTNGFGNVDNGHDDGDEWKTGAEA